MATSHPNKHQAWALSTREALRLFSSRVEGLDDAQVTTRLAQHGPNVLPGGKQASPFWIFLRQLESPLLIILIIAGIITAFLQEWLDAGVIFVAVLVNTVMGYWQEQKAEKTLEHLTEYVRTFARVRRNGTERMIEASNLVIGDIVRLTQGDRVPADMRLLSTSDLQIDESVLTGESLPSKKITDVVAVQTLPADQTNMAFRGTFVVQGTGEALVVATGAHTEFGRIAELSTTTLHEVTPLQRSVSRFAAWSSAALLNLTLLVFAFGIANGYRPLDMFVIAVAIAVSAVPEGLPIAMTTILAIGVGRLARKKGVVRKLIAAEALGSTTLILTDKTGTLTTARMTVDAVVPPPGSDARAAEHILQQALFNVDVSIENPTAAPDHWVLNGRPMEIALVRYAAMQHVLLPAVHVKAHVVDRLPFDSRQKYSLSFTQHAHAIQLTALGAPEILLAGCDMTTKDREIWLEEIGRRTAEGERLIAVATKEIPKFTEASKHDAVSHLTFCGLICFTDPLRPGMLENIQRIAEAGVRTAIVTGDHLGTATAVARALGFNTEHDAVIDGNELRALSDSQLLKRLPSLSVFARVTPEEKLRIAKLYQSLGEIVAVTGDGVNDAPALQTADVGIAVGSGTDVAKSAADLIILDDNFETIVTAIGEGRRIMDNIRKVIVYLLTDAFDELVLIGGAMTLGVAMPITALQILFVNLFSDSFPAIAFAFERQSNPFARGTSAHHPFFDREMKFLIFVIGALSSTMLFVCYLLFLRIGLDAALARTFIFGGFASYSLFAAFSLRDLKTSIFHYNPFSNRVLNAGVGVGFFLTLLAIYLPFLNRALDTVPLPLPWLLAVFAFGIATMAAVEFGKWLFRENRSARQAAIRA